MPAKSAVQSSELVAGSKNHTHKPMHCKSLLAVAAVGLSGLAAQAFPIAAPGTEGFSVIVAGPDPITATYEGNSAGYDNFLYLERDASLNPGVDGDQSNDLFVFFNHGNPVGDTKLLGSFTPGTELVFRLFVNNTGDNFYSGPGSRNGDLLPHARVQTDWHPSTTLVSFEDLFGTPEGANGFNDLSFSFSNTRGVSTVPEALPTSWCLAAVSAGMAFVGRVRSKAKA